MHTIYYLNNKNTDSKKICKKIYIIIFKDENKNVIINIINYKFT